MPLSFEYLDPDALLASSEFATVESFLHARRTALGWHYITDLTWIYRQIGDLPAGSRILDAGGGRGPTQFFLAELGFDVVNIDLALPVPSAVERSRYGTIREVLPSHADTDYVRHLRQMQPTGLLRRLGRSALFGWWRGIREGRRLARWKAGASGRAASPPGSIAWKVGNLCRIPEIPDGHFDAVVSLSAIEHIPSEALPSAWQELRRVVRPGGRWAITTSASPTASSWFHEPSQGWCFSQRDIEQRLGAVFTGKLAAVEALERYRASAYLRRNLADFYRKSGNNGMPWGVWDPRYVPVGIHLSP